MATRDYWAHYFNGTTSVTGLSPTFIAFINSGGSNITPPSITEPGSKGLYKFAYDATQTIAFIMDGATSALSSNVRYISGTLDPQDLFGVTLNAMSATLGAMGTTLSGMGNTLAGVGSTSAAAASTIAGIATSIGSTASSFGSTSVDPVTIFGFLMRAQEFQEGNQTYVKSTGIMDFYSRGSSMLLREKTISDNSTQTTKT